MPGARRGEGVDRRRGPLRRTVWRGFQLSLATRAGEMKGLQIGLLNRARELSGLQLGLLNFNGKGFLPVFPFFNFGVDR